MNRIAIGAGPEGGGGPGFAPDPAVPGGGPGGAGRGGAAFGLKRNRLRSGSPAGSGRSSFSAWRCTSGAVTAEGPFARPPGRAAARDVSGTSADGQKRETATTSRMANRPRRMARRRRSGDIRRKPVVSRQIDGQANALI